jgi:hypothetical protein
MEKNPFVIYAASDSKYGDFLIDHWFRSLRDCVDLSKTDVRILDYGLTTAQRYYLAHEGAGVVPCVKDGHVAVVRFRDLARDLRKAHYQQVLAVDGGDIVFQTDIAPLFELSPDRFRAVPEDLNSGFDIFLKEDYFSKGTIEEIRRTTALRRQINAGFLLGPRRAFLDLCDTIGRLVLDPTAFGPDQLVVNLVLHRDGYVSLPRGYNFVVATARREFCIEGGVFRFADDGSPIPVVHNAGNWKFLRPIENFGYGPTHNRLKVDVLRTLRILHQSNDLIQTTRGRIRRFARSALRRNLAS